MLSTPYINDWRMRHSVSGFTLIEVIGVLIIMSILLFAAVPRFFDRNAYDVRLFEDRIQAMIQYAQKIAIAQNRNVFVRLSGTSVALCLDGACSNKLAAPGGANSGTTATKTYCSGNSAWMCEGIPSGVTYAENLATGGIFFNGLGQPFTTSNGNALTGQLAISLTSDGQSRSVYIEPETGYVHP